MGRQAKIPPTRAAMALAAAVAFAAAQGRSRAATAGRAQEPAAASPRIEDTLSRAIAASRPGPEHQWLEPLVGRWKTDTLWDYPNQAPLHATGTSENHWILDGRFLLSESASGEGAARVERMAIYGFDTREKKFFALSLDNLRTSYLEAWGTYDAVSRSFVASGKERDEATGRTVVHRQLLKIEGPDRHVLRVFLDVPGRPPLKVIETTFTRR